MNRRLNCALFIKKRTNMKSHILQKARHLSAPWVLLLMLACNKSKSVQSSILRHDVEIVKDAGMLYVDKVPNSVVMQNPETDSVKTVFQSFLVGFKEYAAEAEPQTALARGVYFQYRMSQDWVALINGDSIRPVFSQSKVAVSQLITEQYIVFEIPKGTSVYTLVYRDSFGPWEEQKITFKN